MNRNSMRIWMLSMTMLLALGGCMEVERSRNRSATNSGLRKDTSMEEGPRIYGSQQRQGPIVHANTQLAYSEDLSKEVSKLNGVALANVLVTDHNAYVAVLINNTSTGTQGSGAKKETNNSGTSLGRYNPQTFGQYADPDMLATGVNSDLTVENHEDLAHAFKQRIAVKIRQLDPSLFDVYISANRDYVNRTHMYAQEARLGKPLAPYIGEFNDMANRYFGEPEQHAAHR
ncbi:MAG: YhcN/YlaJ family sporulation lipoprotein [Paenibacillaceae bacterium]|nr:YhcN/YlaJ family sporulation lipoprotein [Paenibacillaceae bacterium]